MTEATTSEVTNENTSETITNVGTIAIIATSETTSNIVLKISFTILHLLSLRHITNSVLTIVLQRCNIRF